MVAESDTLLTELSTGISRGSPVPLHHQLRQLLQDQIERGSLCPGQQIPHERQYAEHLGTVSRPCGRRCWIWSGRVTCDRVRGKGTFVRDDKVIEKVSLLGSFTDSLRSQGLEPTFTVTCAKLQAPPPAVRAAFDGKPRRLFRLERLASVADSPLALLTAWLDLNRFPGLDEQDFAAVPLYSTLESRYGVQLGRALSTIEVVQVRDDEAALLQLTPGASALQVQGTTFDQDDRATEVSRVLYRADRFTFSLESYRVGGRLTHVIGSASDGASSPVDPALAGQVRRK